MKISELAARSGVPVSTVKFYLREGLLAPGERSAPNQARYDASHLERLALIRALREVAGLGIEVVREVLVQLDRGWEDGDPVGAALRADSPALPTAAGTVDPQALAAARRDVRDFLEPCRGRCPGTRAPLRRRDRDRAGAGPPLPVPGLSGRGPAAAGPGGVAAVGGGVRQQPRRSARAEARRRSRRPHPARGARDDPVRAGVRGAAPRRQRDALVPDHRGSAAPARGPPGR